MTKKSKRKNIPLLTYLLRELRGRPTPDDGNENKCDNIDAYVRDLSDPGRGGKHSPSLLSLLLRDFRARPSPEEIKAQQDKELTIEDLGDDEDDMENDENGSLKPQSRKSLDEGRFEVLPSKGIEEDYQKRARESGRYLDPTGVSKTRLDGDNYRQMYLDQKAQEQALADEMAKEKLAAASKLSPADTARQKASDQQKEIELRYRARDLQTQIEYWKTQRGQGTYDDVTIDTNLTNLEYELNSIPPTFWTV